MGGHSLAHVKAGRLDPRANSRSCAGSCMKHGAVHPGLAGNTLWPVHWPFCRLWPGAHSSSCLLPLTFHPPVQDEMSPPARRRSVLPCHSSRSCPFGFTIKPFSWQLPKVLIAPAPPVFHGFQDWLAQTKAHPFHLLTSSPLQANSPLCCTLTSSVNQASSKHILPTLPDIRIML